MKTTSHLAGLLRGSGFTFIMAVVGSLALLSPASAQYRATGEDGIPASPKLREQLNERRAPSDPAVAVMPTMACPKCKDGWVTQTDTTSKGLGARTLMGKTTALVAKHLCPRCGVDWTVTGTGKAKQVVATHNCSSCGVEDFACCAPKASGATPTKGMEPAFQIAPAK